MAIETILDFFKTGIWRIRSRELPRPQAFLLKIARIVLLTLRALSEDRIQLRASSLTFFSLLSVVPVLAMLFGIAKGFGMDRALEQQLFDRMEGQEQALAMILDFAHRLLENTQGGVIAGIGVVVLFWSIISVLGNIEMAFNSLWGVKKGRTLWRKITDYLSVCLLGPFLLIISGAASVLIAAEAMAMVSRFAFLDTLSPSISFFLRLLPLGALWVLFSFIYIFMPNTRVRFGPGILAGVVTGTCYQAFQEFYITLQVGVSKYNAVYGSFAALPLFMVWLQLSWIIVLLGAQLSYACQNVDDYEQEPDARGISPWFRKLLAIQVVHFLVKDFGCGHPVHTPERIAAGLKVPKSLVAKVLEDLRGARLVAELRLEGGDGSSAFQVACDPDGLTIQAVLHALEHRGADTLPLAPNEDRAAISRSLEAFDDLIRQSPANLLLKKIQTTGLP